MKAGALVLAALAGGWLSPTGVVHAQTWNFDVRLDGKPIGTHRFEVSGSPEARTVLSDATLAVKLLGMTVFRYRHQAQERWAGDCLAALQSTTDDDGKAQKVDWRRPEDNAAKADCVMAYAYWNPLLVQQTRLFNPQTGKIDQVRVERLPDAPIQVAGREVSAARWQLITTPPAGEPQRLTLWLNPSDQRWLGLDASVRGDRVLTYRLQ